MAPFVPCSLSGNRLGPAGAAALAPAIAANGALTSIDLSRNDLTHYGRDMTGIKELAAALGANGALTECNLQCDPCIGEEGEALIRKAMQGKAGFKLRI